MFFFIQYDNEDIDTLKKEIENLTSTTYSREIFKPLEISVFVRFVWKMFFFGKIHQNNVLTI